MHNLKKYKYQCYAPNLNDKLVIESHVWILVVIQSTVDSNEISLTETSTHKNYIAETQV